MKKPLDNAPAGQARKILIVDDEPLARNRLENLCARIDSSSVLQTAASGLEAIDMAAKFAPDFILLDIDMPDMSGIEVAKKCLAEDAAPQIIFTTAHSKYAVEAFRLNAADYLLKPVKESLLSEALSRAGERAAAAKNSPEKQPAIAAGDENIWVQDRNGAILIRCGDIERIEADRDYMRIYLSDQNFWVHETLTSLQDRLPDILFVRINRSTLVRKDLIREVRRHGRRTFAIFTDGSEHNIGPVFLDAVTRIITVQAGGSGLSDTVTE